MRISLVPVVLSPSELKIIAVAARVQGSSISEFIVRSSLIDALAICGHPLKDMQPRGRSHRKRLEHCRASRER